MFFVSYPIFPATLARLWVVPPQPRVFKVRFYLAFFYFEMNYLSSESYTSKKMKSLAKPEVKGYTEYSI